jgi:endonuclease/exonuclease/phosphatase (EEP) superfamily protein YafD
LIVIGVFCLVVAVAGVVLHFTAIPWQPVIAAASFARIAMWLALPALGVCVGARQWALAAVAGAAVIIVVLVQSPAYVSASATANVARLNVLQANLKLGSADPAALARLVAADDVDLMATEELTASEEQRLLDAGLGDLLPYRYTSPAPAAAGLGIWSRFPLRHKTALAGFKFGVLRAEVMTPGRAITFVAVHLRPPYPYPVHDWLSETARLRRILPSVPGPTLVAGDFNATVDHVQFRRLLSHGFADATRQSGAGYLATYPANRWYGPLLAIDHVLTRSAVATSTRSVSVPGSDHRGLLVALKVDQI